MGQAFPDPYKEERDILKAFAVLVNDALEGCESKIRMTFKESIEWAPVMHHWNLSFPRGKAWWLQAEGSRAALLDLCVTLGRLPVFASLYIGFMGWHNSYIRIRLCTTRKLSATEEETLRKLSKAFNDACGLEDNTVKKKLM